ncbi:SusC/RagA family TonB-linked outer membrane protein [Chitinophaga sp. ysch24]|uniref:SusC/RagA family TonB-linked outer membrane protein n=2 Tax=Chitinophaga tropicalis TaxID=2683588 RepID=A0A7K1U0A8_9BACT|nr:SusC/RagA family TonB-linked outer membrane protein [Chitinophaga tropicalis]
MKKTAHTRVPCIQAILFLMRCSVYILAFICTSTFTLFASTMEGQNIREVKINLNASHQKLEEVLGKIQQLTPFRFVYNSSQVKAIPPVSINVTNTSVETILQQLLTPNHFSFEQNKAQVIITRTQDLTFATLNRAIPTMVEWADTSITAQGKVRDDKGQPLPGVTITIKGKNRGVAADASGNFAIRADEKDSLIFKAIGFAPLTVSAGGNLGNIALSPSTTSLSDVVIVGYGSQTRRDLTGTITTVKGADIRNLPVSDAAQAIQGRVAGVDIVRSDGSPGTTPSIRIRGTGTINNSEPLIIIDGVPASSLSDINNNDIASMEVLKDASSSAIYGTRAANGVIIITTKKGSYNEKLNTSVNIYRGVSNVRRYIPLLTAPELVTLKQERYTNDGLSVPAIWQDPYYAVQRTDWQKALFNTGNVTNADISIRGGSAFSNYLFSVGYYDEKGMITNTYFKRYTVRINSEHRLNKRLKVGENLQLTARKRNALDTYSSQTGLIFSALRFNPAIPVKDETGAYGSAQASNELGDINNPVYTAETTDAWVKSYRVLANAFAELEIVRDLKFRVNYAFDGTLSNSYTFLPKTLTQVRTRDDAELTQGDTTSNSQLAEAFLTFNKTLAQKHQITLTGGVSYQKYTGSYFAAKRNGFDDESPDMLVLDNGSLVIDAAGNYHATNVLASSFVRGFYSFKGKYLLTATMRADGSSRFAEGHRWGYFPAVSAGWRVSDENFFKENVHFMSNLKVTGGWGVLGNQNVSEFQYLAAVAKNRRYNFGDLPVTGTWNASIANPNITWEKAHMTNISMEMGFLQSALNATVTYFNKNTIDMLVPAVQMDTHGTSVVPDQNIGRLNNHGVELELSYQGGKKDFTYFVAANATMIRNKVTKLYAKDTYISSSNYGRQNQEISRTYEGQPIASFYGWKTAGLYQTQSEIDNDAYLANDSRRANIKPGDVRFVDVNGDGAITEADRVNLGDPNPRLQYGIQMSGNYKGFDLSLAFTGVAGVKLYNADKMQGLDPTYSYNYYKEEMNRWHGEGTSNSIPRMTLTDNNGNYRTSDRFIEKGDYFALRNVALGYTIPAKLWGNAGGPGIRVYVAGQNMFILTNYSGLNPELGYTDGNRQRGVDVATYPQARSITVGASLNF